MKKSIPLFVCWELMCYNPECITTINSTGSQTALDYLDECERVPPNVAGQAPFDQTRQKAKEVLLMMADEFDILPQVPSDAATIDAAESCLAQLLGSRTLQFHASLCLGSKVPFRPC